MPWPTPQDYNEAIQTPAHAFADPDLAGGQPELTRLGLPRPIAGNFANVYHVTGGGREWAVRCFLREVPDQRERYAAISRHLQKAGLRSMVGFVYQPRGIRVKGDWYPILKMEWLHGQTLGAYVAQHAADTRILAGLAGQWADLMTALARARLAHGDLQHGNILVVNGRLRLIDYDGMFVPALQGRPSLELGHRNYQHPARGERDFGPELDRFAGWVIYLGLLGLATDPTLWDRFGGDEHLLLARPDFDHPDASPVLQALAASRDARVRGIAAAFRAICAGALAEVPPLAAAAQARPPKEAAAALMPAAARPAPPQAPAPWWREHLPPTPAPVPAAPAPEPSPTGADRRWAWGLLAAWAATVAALVAARSPAALASAVGAAELAGLLGWHGHRYRRRPELAARRRTLAELRAAEAAVAGLERAEQRLLAERGAANQSELSELAALRTALQALQDRHLADLRQLDAELQQGLATLAGRRRDVAHAEADALAAGLEALRQHGLALALRRHALADAVVTGVGPLDKRRLAEAGIRTAADFTEVRVTLGVGGNPDTVFLARPDRSLVQVAGITSRKANALEIWRRYLVSRYAPDLPHALSPAERSAIATPFEAERRQLEQEEAKLHVDLRRRRDALTAAFAREEQAVVAQVAAVQSQAAVARGTIDRQLERNRAEQDARRAAITAARQTLDAFREISFLAYLGRLHLPPRRAV